MACAHTWNIIAIEALTAPNGEGVEMPEHMEATLCCAHCGFLSTQQSLLQVRDLIRAGQIAGASLAQWDSANLLFS